MYLYFQKQIDLIAEWFHWKFKPYEWFTISKMLTSQTKKLKQDVANKKAILANSKGLVEP